MSEAEIVPLENKKTDLSPVAKYPQSDVVLVPPHNIEVEEALIACCLMDGACERINELLAKGFKPEFFYHVGHQTIFAALIECSKVGGEVDEIVLWEYLCEQRQNDEVGGINAIYAIKERVETTLQFGRFVDTIHTHYLARLAIRRNNEANERLYNNEHVIDVVTTQRKTVELVESAVNQSIASEMRGLGDFTMIRDDDPMVLLGKKYLNRGHICALVSTSGMGKSSISIQLSIFNALERRFGGEYGIKPNGPLKTLIIQSEDDESDIGEVAQSIFWKMQLSAEERRLVSERVKIVTDRTSRGDKFFARMRTIARKFEPDIIVLNPLLAFMDGDISHQKDCGKFFREGLEACNHEDAAKRWAYVLVHHTNKPPSAQKGKSEPNWNELMYGMSGSSDITNVCRSVIILQPTAVEGHFVMELAKRGKRAGVKTCSRKPDGEIDPLGPMVTTTRIYLKHCSDRFTPEGWETDVACIFWEGREPDESELKITSEKPKSSPGRKKIEVSIHDLRYTVPPDKSKAVSMKYILRHFKEISPISISDDLLRKRIRELVNTGELAYNDGGLIYMTGAVPVQPDDDEDDEVIDI